MATVINALKSAGIIAGGEKRIFDTLPTTRNDALHARWDRAFDLPRQIRRHHPGVHQPIARRSTAHGGDARADLDNCGHLDSPHENQPGGGTESRAQHRQIARYENSNQVRKLILSDQDRCLHGCRRRADGSARWQKDPSAVEPVISLQFR